MSDELSNATRIAELEEQVRQLQMAHAEVSCENARLTNDMGIIGNRASMDREEIDSMAKRNDELRADIQDMRSMYEERSDYNQRLLAENVRLSNEAAEVREELEQYRMRLAGALIASEGGDGQPSDALEYLQNCPTITSVTKVRHALDRERERCGVLERECRKWRDEWTKRYNQNADVWMLAVAEMAETDRTNALNAAKFVAKSGGGQ